MNLLMSQVKIPLKSQPGWSSPRAETTLKCVDVAPCHLMEARSPRLLPATKHRLTRWPARRAHFHAINAALSLAAGGGSEKKHPFVGWKLTETQPRRGVAWRGAVARQTYTSAAHPATFPRIGTKRLRSTRAPECD